MKVKLQDKIEKVLVTCSILEYSMDGLSLLTAKEGDVIDIPFRIAEGLESEGKISKDVPEEEEEEEEEEEVEEEEEEEVEEGEEFSFEELKAMTEVDFAEMKVEEVKEWSEKNLNFAIPANVKKHETVVAKVLEQIDILEEE